MKNRLYIALALVLVLFTTGMASAYTPATYTAQKVFIPYTSITGKWWTGLAITNESAESHNYYLIFYAENGDLIASGCITVNAHAIFTDALQNYFINGDWVDGHVSIEIIQVSDSSVKFSATLFMGNTAESRGFGFQSFRSEDYEMFADLMCQELPY